MGEIFFKALKWFIFVVFIIGGIAAFEAVEAHGIRYGMLAVMGFGGAYVMSGPWRALPPKPMIVSILSIALLAFIAKKIPEEALYIYFGVEQSLNFYITWIALTFILGIPFMMFIFSKYDK